MRINGRINFKMSRFVIKNLIIKSLILGFLLGIAASIPYVGIIALWLVFLFAAPAVIVYTIMEGKFDLTDIKSSIICGGLIGFCANFTFCCIYALLSLLIIAAFGYSENFILTSMITKTPVWLFVVCILFIGVLTAVTNAFSAFITYYAINFIRDWYDKKHDKDDCN